MPNSSLANKKKWKVQQPDGSVVSFWGPRDMDFDKVGEAAGFQAQLEQQKKDQRKFELADKLFPQTNSGMGRIAAGFSDFMNNPLLPEAQSGEQYFQEAQPAANTLEAVGQGIQGFGRDVYNKMVRPFSSPTGMAGIVAGGLAPRLAAGAFGGAMAPGAAMDIGEFAQDPTLERGTQAMESTGATMLGLGGAMMRPAELPPPRTPNITNPPTGPALPPPSIPKGLPGLGGEVMPEVQAPPPPQGRTIPFAQRSPINPTEGLSDTNPMFGMGRINKSLEVARGEQKALPPSPIEAEINAAEAQPETPPPSNEPVMGKKFEVERRSRDERLAPEVLDESRKQAADTMTDKIVSRKPEPPEPFTPPKLEKGQTLEGYPNVTYEGEGMGGVLYKYGGKEGNNFSTKKGASNQEFIDEYNRAKAGYDSRIANEAKKAQPPAPEPKPQAPEIVEQPKPEVIEQPKFEAKQVGEHTIEASGDPKLPYQLKKGDTVIAKGLKPTSFDGMLKRDAELQAKLKAIDEKYRDVDDDLEAPSTPKGFQEEEFPQPTPEEREMMRVERPSSRKVERSLKKKEFPLAKGRPGERGSLRLYDDENSLENRASEAVENELDAMGIKTTFEGPSEIKHDHAVRNAIDNALSYADQWGINVKELRAELSKKLMYEDDTRKTDTSGQPIKKVYREEQELANTEAERLARQRKKERGSISTKPVGEEISHLTKKRQDLTIPALDVVAGLGKSGKEIARLTTRGRLVGEHYAGMWEDRVKEVLNDISDEEFGHVNADNKVLRGNLIDVLEGRESPKNDKIRMAADQIKAILDESAAKAKASDMSLRVGNKNVPFEARENYFPHLYTGKFWARVKRDPQFKEKILERIIKQNPGMTMDAAAKTLQRARQFGERLIDPQHERVFNLPGWERTKGALYKHLHDMGRQIGNAEELGPKDIAGPKLDTLIKQTKDPEYAYELMERIMKREKPLPIRDVKLANKVTSTASWLYLSRAAIGNLAQITRVPLHSSFTSAAKAFGKYLTDRQGFYRDGLNSGAIVEIGAKGLMEEFGTGSKAYKTYGIEQSEKFLRSIASAAGRAEAEAAFRVLKKNPANKSARVRLADILQEDPDVVLKQEKLTDKQSAIAGGRMAELTQGRAEAMDLPKDWSRSPYAAMYFLYKKYALQDTRNMWKAIKKNPVKSLATIAVLNQAAGEMVGDVKEALKGFGIGLVKGDIGEHLTDKVSKRGEYLLKDNPELGRFFDNYLQSWTFGVLSDALQNIKKGEFAGTIGEMASDLVTTAGSSAKKLYEGKKEPLKPIAKTATQMIPVLGPGIREGLFPKEKPKQSGPPRLVLRRPHMSR